MENQERFRAGLKFYRKNLGVTQAELAAVAHISHATIANFEAHLSNLSENSMERIRKALLELVRDRTTVLANFPLNSDMHAGAQMRAGV